MREADARLLEQRHGLAQLAAAHAQQRELRGDRARAGLAPAQHLVHLALGEHLAVGAPDRRHRRQGDRHQRDQLPQQVARFDLARGIGDMEIGDRRRDRQRDQLLVELPQSCRERRVLPVDVHRGYATRILPDGFQIVAIAASAGGLNALTHVLAELPRDFPAALLVVQHVDPRHRSLLADILSRRTQLVVKEAAEGSPVAAGNAFIAPPNRHLLVNPDRTVSLTQTELVHFVRPSADLLFESVAATYKERAIAVVLSGSGQDGAMGVRAIKKMGGTVIVQDSRSAEFSGMPDAAAQTGTADFVLALDEIAPALRTLCAPPA